MADGYGFGAEGDWKSSMLVRIVKAMSEGLAGGVSLHGGLHLRLRHRFSGDPRRAHAGDLPDHRRGQALLRDPPALRGRARGPRAPRLHRQPPVQAWSWAWSTWARACGWWPTRSTPSTRPRTARSCRWHVRCGCRGRTSRPRPNRGCWPGARTTRRTSQGIGLEVIRGLRRDGRSRAAWPSAPRPTPSGSARKSNGATPTGISPVPSRELNAVCRWRGVTNRATTNGQGRSDEPIRQRALIPASEPSTHPSHHDEDRSVAERPRQRRITHATSWCQLQLSLRQQH